MARLSFVIPKGQQSDRAFGYVGVSDYTKATVNGTDIPLVSETCRNIQDVEEALAELEKDIAKIREQAGRMFAAVNPI